MKTKFSAYLLLTVSLIVAACGERQGTDDAEQATPEFAAESIPQYSAEDFFATSSFGLVGSAAHAFSGIDKLITQPKRI